MSPKMPLTKDVPLLTYFETKYVYALLGEQAAKEQAGHATNMTASYLDTHLLRKLQNKPNVIDVLPRPK